MAKLAEIDMGKILNEKCIILSVPVKMPRFWQLRFRLAGCFVGLAARIAGVGYRGIVYESEGD